MALSLNEIKIRAQQFVLNWKDKAATAREEADAQTFENEFFAIFGVPRSIVYNNFPWPEVSDAQKAAIMQNAQAVLDARSQFPDSSLADLYDPNNMPPVLTKAHVTLDSAVDKLYRKTAFSDDAARTAFLFELYGKKTEGLLAGKRKGGKR
ncbi:type IIL restriction-modification enzyme MmeI [Treponema socranskii]|uniref:type IIL restriction-modification enzyme MmeI n=1 Tax=Treponema socranskii TaxID=53419 RepID=UPI003D6F9FAE